MSPSQANIDVQHVLCRVQIPVTKERSAFLIPALSAAPEAMRYNASSTKVKEMSRKALQPAPTKLNAEESEGYLDDEDEESSAVESSEAPLEGDDIPTRKRTRRR
jgi:hypothetical protein